MKHTIYDHELKLIKDASDVLFNPQPGQKMDERSAYQAIHYTIEEVNNRLW